MAGRGGGRRYVLLAKSRPPADHHNQSSWDVAVAGRGVATVGLQSSSQVASTETIVTTTK